MAPVRQVTDDESPQSPQGTSKESATTSDTLVGSQKSFRNRLKFKNPLRKNTEESESIDRVGTEKSTKSERQKAAFKRKIPIKH